MRAKFSMMSQWGGSRAHTIFRGLSKLIWQWKIHITKKGGATFQSGVLGLPESLYFKVSSPSSSKAIRR